MNKSVHFLILAGACVVVGFAASHWHHRDEPTSPVDAGLPLTASADPESSSASDTRFASDAVASQKPESDVAASTDAEASAEPSSPRRPAAALVASLNDGPAPAVSLGLAGLLAKYSGSREWRIENDDAGKPLRLTGSALRVMAGDETESHFIDEFTQEIGFKSRPPLERVTSRTGRFTVIDYLQSYRLPDGKTLSVYSAWLRLKGTSDDGAHTLINLLKPVGDGLLADANLSTDEAVAIARREVELKPDATLNVRAQPVIFADRSPQQKAWAIDTGGPLPHWLILVGFETRSVILKTVTSRH